MLTRESEATVSLFVESAIYSSLVWGVEPMVRLNYLFEELTSFDCFIQKFLCDSVR